MILFIAIPLSNEMRSATANMQDAFRWQSVSGNYSPVENFHITLAYIGEYPDPDEVLDLLSNVTFEPFTITMDKIGCFDDLWWMGLAESRELENLVKSVRHVLADAGISYDKRRFKAHITFLKRAVFPEGSHASHLSMPPVSMKVTKFSLMLSTRGKKDMIYTELGAIEAKEV